MRNKPTQPWLRHAVAGALSLCAATTLVAQPYTNITIETFDTDLSEFRIGNVGGNAAGTVAWTGADGNPAGALSVQANWANLGGGWQEVQVNYPWTSVDAGAWFGLTVAPYATIEFDVKVEGAPPAATDGTFGRAQLVLQGFDGNGQNSGAGWVPLGLVPIPATNVWQHISHKLTPFERFNLNQIVINIVGQNATNPITYLVDNLEIKVPTAPPPTLTMSPVAGGGLNLIAASGQYSRENIRTVGTNYTWYGAGGAVNYSFTISQNPPDPYNNFQTHLMLIPNPPAASDSAPDWGSANVLRLDIYNTSGGGGNANLRFKTNSPSSNGGYYTDVSAGGGQYPPVPSASVVGTWKLTFTQNTNVAVTAPDGAVSNYVLSADAAAFFNSPNLRVYLGAMPNQVANVGQKLVLSSANITGAAGSLSDNFAGPDLNSTLWEKSAAAPNNIFIVSSSVAYNLTWPLPDNLFKLATSTDVQNLTNSGLDTAVTQTSRSAAIAKNYPGTNQGFFGLVKRVPTKLQVLMPGETAAPGTPAGKAGTPVNQAANVPFLVRINAVDDNWNVAFSDHQVFLESQPTGDGSGFKWAPQLVHGSYSFTFTNTTAGTFQINVVDSVDNTKTGSGSSYTVAP